MDLSEIISLILLFIIIYLFCQVEVIPFASAKTKYIVIGGTAAMMLARVFVVLCFPQMPESQVSLITESIPSLVMCWTVARHKDMRFWFVFCSLDVISFMLLLIASGAALLAGWSNNAAALLRLGVMLVFVLIFRRYLPVFRQTIDKVSKNWGLLTALVLIFYAYSYFLILYPSAWKDRLEYSPVFMGYGVVILLCYAIIVKMIINMGKIQELEQKEFQMKLEIEEKKAQVLVKQIQPHFIYNVLSSIRYLIKKEPDTAYDLTYDFSQYLRSNVDFLTENGWIHWKEELEHIQVFIRIEKQRYKEKLNVCYEIEDVDFDMPPLMVEPLVENAIKHGIAKKEGGGTLWIRCKQTGDGYQVEIEDDGNGFDVTKLEGEKAVGISYIQTRLQAMPGSDMVLKSIPGQGTKVTLFFQNGGG